MNKKLFGLMALIICVCAGFTACSDDDDDDNKSGIVGLWEATHYVDWYESDGAYNPEAWEEEDDEDRARVEFTSNGKAIFYYYDNGNWEYDEEVSYKVSGNELILLDGNNKTKVTIDELTATTLIITETGYDNGKFIVRTKFRRVK